MVDGAIRLDCRGLHDKATALAQTLMGLMPAGSVVSFMLPNWHEAAVIYLGATLAGMVVNPILPSLRDRELAFILCDADSGSQEKEEVFHGGASSPARSAAAATMKCQFRSRSVQRGCAPARQDMFKQEAMKPGKVLIMAFWLLNYSSAFLRFS
jgi:acyl-coenzyme A synthetase/AMP-(fatty) acid ligase